MPAIWALCDYVTDTEATFTVRVASGSTRIAVSTASSLSNAVHTSAASPTNGVVKLTISGLTPDTDYWWAPEIAGDLDLDTKGHFDTNPEPGTPIDLSISAFSCAGGEAQYPGVIGGELVPARVSNSPGFSDVRSRPARKTVHMGDWTYYNLGSDAFGIVGGGSVSNYRTMFDNFLSQPNQRALYLDRPITFQADDHEGPNDHDRNYDQAPNLRSVFGERVPHAPLPVPGTLYREEVIGRTLLLYLDVRSDRDPNSTPDGPGKSMLGEAQRARIAATLAASDEVALVIFSPSVWWEPGREDGWAGFQNEQQWLIGQINASGFGGRTVVVCGDVHALGIDTGSNSPGGIPTATFASLDSDGGSSLNHNSRGPTKPGRRQHGIVRVNDLGDRVTIHLTGYVGTELWDSWSFSYDVDPPDPGPGPGPGPGPEPEPPPATDATPKEHIEWLACDLVTGDKLAYLPNVKGSISRALGAYTSDTLTIPLPLSGPSNLGPLLYDATAAGRTMLVAVVNNVPAWAGIVRKIAGGSATEMQLAMQTLEAFLVDRYVRDHNWVNRDEASVIAAGIAADANDQGINLVIDAPPTGTLRDRQYFDTDDGRVYDRLTELMGVEGGPEWTIDLAWANERKTAVAKILRVRKHIGLTVPRVTLSTRGAAKATYQYALSYNSGEGATDIMATSSGEGADRPQSGHFTADGVIAAGMPRWEHRFSPSSAIKEQETLASHARAKLIEIGDGTESIEVTCRWNVPPARLGIDVNVGDWVEYDLVGHMHPTGLQGVGRLIGWKLDPQNSTYTPTLLLPGQGVSDAN